MRIEKENYFAADHDQSPDMADRKTRGDPTQRAPAATTRLVRETGHANLDWTDREHTVVDDQQGNG